MFDYTGNDRTNEGMQYVLTFLQLFTTIVICFLFCLCTLVAYIVNNMDPDQAAV